MKYLEDDFFLRFFAVEGSFLDDIKLVESLEMIKAIVVEIEYKVGKGRGRLAVLMFFLSEVFGEKM